MVKSRLGTSVNVDVAFLDKERCRGRAQLQTKFSGQGEVLCSAADQI